MTYGLMQPSWWTYVIWCAAAYLLGSIPNGLLVARSRGVDIRQVGSGNIGATNVLRTLGKPLGILTFALDALKGFLPAFVFPHLAGAPSPGLGVAGAVAAILGHNFPIFLGFKGGKGVATSAGALIGIAPWAAVTGLAVWGLVFFTTRYVSLASIAAALGTVAAGWLLYYAQGPLLPVTLTILGFLVILRHRGNIQRLLSGTEHRFERKAKGP